MAATGNNRYSPFRALEISIHPCPWCSWLFFFATFDTRNFPLNCGPEMAKSRCFSGLACQSRFYPAGVRPGSTPEPPSPGREQSAPCEVAFGFLIAVGEFRFRAPDPGPRCRLKSAGNEPKGCLTPMGCRARNPWAKMALLGHSRISHLGFPVQQNRGCEPYRDVQIIDQLGEGRRWGAGQFLPV